MRCESRTRVSEKAMAGLGTKFWVEEVFQSFRMHSRDELQSERRDAEARHCPRKSGASLRTSAHKSAYLRC